MHTGRWIGDLAPEPAPPQEGRWITRPQKPRWMVPTLGLTILGSQLPNWINVIANGRSGLGAFRFLLLAFLVVVAGALVVSLIRGLLARRIRRKDAFLVDGAFGDQFPVEVTIVAERIKLGTDRGVVWFADGLMGFSGASASFVLAAWDVETRRAGRPSTMNGPGLPRGSLELVHAPVPSYVVITPLGKTETHTGRGSGSSKARAHRRMPSASGPR